MTTPLEVMRTLAGTQWSAGPATGAVRGWVEFIASTYPDRGAYVRQAELQYLAWCGLTVGYTVTRCGIRPPPEFLLAMDWASWGQDAKAVPQQGDIAVFAWSSGGHHVTIIDEVAATRLKCFGGNQSHEVNDEPFPRGSCVAVRRAPAAISVVPPLTIPQPTGPVTSNFNACVALVLVSEGGNDDDPNDPGGRTSRGILQSEWDIWRRTHSGLPSDVWQAPQDQIIAIYKAGYWEKFGCDQMPAGVDYAVFDTRIMSGRGIHILQAVLGVDQDGEVGPDTLGAIHKFDSAELINKYQDQRLAYLQGLPVWNSFHNGWTSRVTRVRRDALGMVTKGKAAPGVPAPPRPAIAPPPKAPKTHSFDTLFGGDWRGGLNQMFGGKK